MYTTLKYVQKHILHINNLMVHIKIYIVGRGATSPINEEWF